MVVPYWYIVGKMPTGMVTWEIHILHQKFARAPSETLLIEPKDTLAPTIHKRVVIWGRVPVLLCPGKVTGNMPAMV